MRKRASLLATCLSALLLGGCASTPDSGASGRDDAGPTAMPTVIEPGEVEYAEFDPDVLFLLLSAEIAAQRGRFDVTLAHYTEAAERSQDRGVIERAMRIAQSLQADNAQSRLAEVWLQIDPDNQEALRISAIQAVRRNDLETAMNDMERILDLGGDADFDSLAVMAENLPAEQQQELLSLYRELETRHPDDPEISYSISLLLKIAGDHDAALTQLEPLLEQQPEFQPALVLKGDLLYQAGRQDEALRHLRVNTRRYPDNRQLGTLYARMLISGGDARAAQDEFRRLLDDYPDNPGLRLSHALVALENNELGVAESDLTQLLRQGHHSSEANYYLGRIADEKGNVDTAMGYYRQVDRGTHYYPALARLSTLMVEDDDLEGAVENLQSLRRNNPESAESLWLIEINLLLDSEQEEQALETANQALEEFPDNTRILYTRAMLLDSAGDFSQAEKDLRQILQEEPENAVALNALGYILTIRTDRLDEARELIEQALAIEPENPAILDSMGWVLFQQGETEESLDYLQKAYESYPDPEVAAHLGEALWENGQQEQARMIWRESLDDNPEDPLILETIQRLGVESEL